MKELKDIKILEIVKNTIAKFSYAVGDTIYYEIISKDITYLFPVNMSENGTTRFEAEYKSLVLMRWIRKSIENETLVYYPNKKEVC